MNKKKTDCPICNNQYYSLSRAEDVCGRHEDWLITECKTCGKLCFSDIPEICRKCNRKNLTEFQFGVLEE